METCHLVCAKSCDFFQQKSWRSVSILNSTISLSGVCLRLDSSGVIMPGADVGWLRALALTTVGLWLVITQGVKSD